MIAAEAPAPASPTPIKTRRRVPLRLILLIGGPILTVLAATLSYSAYREGVQYVSTDNAQVTGQPVQVGSMNAGRVDAITVTIGSRVHRNDVLARVALPSQTGLAQNGQPRFDFLGSADSRVEVAAPFDGVVIALPAAVGANVAPGQPIVSIVNPTEMWVNANIEETMVGRVKVGQVAQVHVDALGADLSGRVEAITPATASSFSLLPTNASSGNFTKIVQLVPVRISMNLGDRPVLLGTSVEVKIRIQD
jgi:multidrug resistance efflux pump